MSKLLINEPPLQVLPSLAMEFGLNEAIVIQQVHYWIQNAKTGFIKDGQKWVANTYEEWQSSNFPFWSVSTVKRIFSNLEEKGVVISEKFETDDWNQRKSYRVNYDLLDGVNLTRSMGSDWSTHNRNTETTAEKREVPQNMPLEWYIQHGLPIPPELTENNLAEKNATDGFESALGFGFLPWDSTKDWQAFKKWVVETHRKAPSAWQQFQEWRIGKGKYEAMSNKQIRQNPRMFIDTGYPAFIASSTMYGREEEKLRML